LIYILGKYIMACCGH